MDFNPIYTDYYYQGYVESGELEEYLKLDDLITSRH